MMTTMAAMLGALPLALGAGDGAELRQPLGIAIVGGLIAVSQLLTLYTTPVVYLYLDRFRLWALRALAASPRAAPALRAAGAMSTNAAMKHRTSRVLLAAARARARGLHGRARLRAARRRRPRRPSRRPHGWKVAQPADAAPRGAWWTGLRRSRARRAGGAGRRRQPDHRGCRSARARGQRRAREAARAALFPTSARSAGAVRSKRAATRRRRRRRPTRLTASRSARAGSPTCGAASAAASKRAGDSAQASAADLAMRGSRCRRCSRRTTSCCACRTRRSRCCSDTVDAYEQSLQLTQNQYSAGVVARGDVAAGGDPAQVDAGASLRRAARARAARARDRRARRQAAGRLRDRAARQLAAVLPGHPARGALGAARAPPGHRRRRAPRRRAPTRRSASRRRRSSRRSSLSANGGLQSSVHRQPAVAARAATGRSARRSRRRSSTPGCAARRRTQAIARYDETVANYRQTVLTGFQEVEDNLAALDAPRAGGARCSRKPWSAARQSAAIAINQYRAGTASYLAVVVLQAERAQQRAHRARASPAAG